MRIIFSLLFLFLSASLFAAGFSKGDTVRLSKRENLLANGKNLGMASKGAEFTVAGMQQGAVLVSYMKEDGTWIAASLPSDSVEASQPAAWNDLVRGMESFRNQQLDERAFVRAAGAPAQADPKAPKDPAPAIAAALLPKLKGAMNAAAIARGGSPAAMQSLGTLLAGLRDLAVQLDAAGHPALAVPLDEGAERLAKTGGLAAAPAGKLDRAAAGARAAAAEKAAILARQNIALRKLIAARDLIEEGIKSAPAHPLLKGWEGKVNADIDEAKDLHRNAEKVRRFDKGLIHALSALDDGLRLCADHPALLALRKDMASEIETRTSPRVDARFIATAKVKTTQAVLEEGRELYVNRCAECHDLEPLDSRGRSGWEKIVGGMSRRANLSGAEQSKIMDYLTAAVGVVE